MMEGWLPPELVLPGGAAVGSLNGAYPWNGLPLMVSYRSDDMMCRDRPSQITQR